jgi:hypothetical protein
VVMMVTARRYDDAGSIPAHAVVMMVMVMVMVLDKLDIVLR